VIILLQDLHQQLLKETLKSELCKIAKNTFEKYVYSELEHIQIQEIFLQNEILKDVHINHFSKIVSMCCIVKGAL
jgi:hypothetical protein